MRMLKIFVANDTEWCKTFLHHAENSFSLPHQAFQQHQNNYHYLDKSLFFFIGHAQDISTQVARAYFTVTEYMRQFIIASGRSLGNCFLGS